MRSESEHRRLSFLGNRLFRNRPPAEKIKRLKLASTAPDAGAFLDDCAGVLRNAPHCTAQSAAINVNGPLPRLCVNPVKINKSAPELFLVQFRPRQPLFCVKFGPSPPFVWMWARSSNALDWRILLSLMLCPLNGI
jgi:hypothetical protein